VDWWSADSTSRIYIPPRGDYRVVVAKKRPRGLIWAVIAVFHFEEQTDAIAAFDILTRSKRIWD
jgi:hypothetical protein